MSWDIRMHSVCLSRPIFGFRPASRTFRRLFELQNNKINRTVVARTRQRRGFALCGVSLGYCSLIGENTRNVHLRCIEKLSRTT